MTTARETLDRGYDAGNYAGVCQSDDLSSYQEEELDGEDLEAFRDAVSSFPEYARDVGAIT